MNHFCVLNTEHDTVFYCSFVQCAPCKRYQAGAIAPRFGMPAPVELYRLVSFKAERAE